MHLSQLAPLLLMLVLLPLTGCGSSDEYLASEEATDELRFAAEAYKDSEHQGLVAFTTRHIRDLDLDEEDIKNIQFYLSGDMTLSRAVVALDSDVVDEGGLKKDLTEVRDVIEVGKGTPVIVKNSDTGLEVFVLAIDENTNVVFSKSNLNGVDTKAYHDDLYAIDIAGFERDQEEHDPEVTGMVTVTNLLDSRREEYEAEWGKDGRVYLKVDYRSMKKVTENRRKAKGATLPE